jgi:hypothetical protein
VTAYIPRDPTLAQAARNACDDPETLAFALAAYQRARALDDHALALWLGVSLEALDYLRLCPRPVLDPYQLRLSRIADAFGIDVGALSDVLALSVPHGVDTRSA